MFSLKKIKYQMFVIFLLLSSVLLGACTPTAVSLPMDEAEAIDYELSKEERQRVDLYVLVMRAAFAEENGGDGYIAINLESLVDLSDAAKQMVLTSFDDLSEQVLSYATIKTNTDYFEIGTEGSFAGMPMAVKNGTVLSINLQEYQKNRARITGESWFSVLGAVFPEYEAKYKNDLWELELISMAIS